MPGAWNRAERLLRNRMIFFAFITSTVLSPLYQDGRLRWPLIHQPLIIRSFLIIKAENVTKTSKKIVIYTQINS